PMADMRRDDQVVFFSGQNQSYTIESGGEMITVNGTQFINGITGAQPLLNRTGNPSAVSHIMLPAGEYNITLTDSDTDFLDAGIQTDNGLITFQHVDGTMNAEQLTIQGTSLMYENTTGESTGLQATVLENSNGEEILFEITNMQVEDNQDVSLEMLDDGLYMTNSGDNTAYDVHVEVYTNIGEIYQTDVSGIPINGGVTQIIIPNFSDDGLSGVTIIDSDGDPDTPDPSTDYENEALPVLTVSSDSLFINNSAQNLTIGVGNLGGGELEWNVMSSPDWMTVEGASSGVNFGSLAFNVEANSGNPRSGNIVVQNINTNAMIAVVYVEQSDVADNIEEEWMSGLAIFPNPGINQLTIQLPEVVMQETANIHLINNLGQKVLDMRIVNGQQGNTDKLASGLYSLVIQTSKGVITKQWMKQ
ncbi:MAG: T9SS type A sorting domain-containing protein, partial [Flavobacteriales bacterium]|nr:T9SS type A sorting domain-containing protein [Flavobacteriales bacterium]